MSEKRKLGNTDLEITSIGLGAWAIGGNGWSYGWGAQEDQDSRDTIHKALDAGINWIDTAAIYGVGHSETVIGQALKEREDKPYVFTKCSRLWNGSQVVGSLQRDSLYRELEASLDRLGVDCIDLYQIHWPRPDSDIEQGWKVLTEMKEQGLVKWIGVSNFSIAQLERISTIAPVSSLQPPYSAANPTAQNELLPYCLEKNIGTIVYSPMQSGLLTGKMTKERVANMPDDDWRKGSGKFQEPQLSRNLALADLLGEIAKEQGQTTATVAIAWTLRLPSVTGAIVGARRSEQVDGIIGALQFRLSEKDIDRIEQFMAN